MSALTKYEESSKGYESLAELQLLAETAMKSKCYGGKSKEEIVMLLLTGRDLGLSPTKSLNSGFWIVQGKIIMSAITMNDMIRSAGHSIRFGEVSDTSCTLIGKRKDNGDSLSITFTMKMAERAGLLKNSVWKQYPEDMLYSNAMKRLARLLFPDVIGNSYDEYSMHEVIQKDTKQKKENVFDHDTIEVENAIPKIEQKPEIPHIPLESLHLAMDVMGCKSDIIDVKEFVTDMSEARGKPEQLIINTAMQNDELIAKFIKSFEIWRTPPPETEEVA